MGRPTTWLSATAHRRETLEYYPVAGRSFIKASFIFNNWWRMRFPMRVCDEFYILKVTLYTVQHWEN